jgi:hypothetical protein
MTLDKSRSQYASCHVPRRGPQHTRDIGNGLEHGTPAIAIHRTELDGVHRCHVKPSEGHKWRHLET